LKRWLTVFSASLLLLLSGCSYLNTASDTLDYVKEATNYLARVDNFAAETPPLNKQVLDNQTGADELTAKLQQMKNDIQSFNTLDVPETVNGFHQEIIEQNNLLTQQIDLYLNDIKDGKLNPTTLENIELLQPVQEITFIIEQIQKLGAQVYETLGA
jgi:peptidoglycan hydrolase CwlO-like protein